MAANGRFITGATGALEREILPRIAAAWGHMLPGPPQVWPRPFAFLLLVTATTDAFAQIWGMLLGTRKLCPRLSPAKTLVTMIGGIATALTVALCADFLDAPSGAARCVCVGLLTAIAAFGGDLLFSYFRRRAGIKDLSRLLPGHGGIRGRLDSMTLAAPVFHWSRLLLAGQRDPPRASARKEDAMTGSRIRRNLAPGIRRGLTALALVLALAGCSKDAITPKVSSVLGPRNSSPVASFVAPADVVEMTSALPPAGVTSIDFGGEHLSLWPYTGTSFDGTPEDPVNLVFVGKADPVAIRAALLALPEDHSGSPLPDAFPFNSRWSDATGDVQIVYADGEGWVGNAIQLQLGRYEFGRVHLRLFRTGKAFGSDGVWTIGAAHFEILIPNTADHQVLSWDLAKAAVVRDLARTGLLDASTPMAQTPVISEAPSFRNIPDFIYSGLPMDLKMLVFQGNPPASGSPGIPSDGKAMILHVGTAATVTPGTAADAFTLTYNQVVPKPFCSTGPLDWVLLQGPISISKTVTVDEAGALQYSSTLSGRLAVTPVDITATPPAPSGTTFYANVSDVQSGAIDASQASVTSQVKRIGNPGSGAEMLMTRLRVSTEGQDQYRLETRCLGPEPSVTARTP